MSRRCVTTIAIVTAFASVVNAQDDPEPTVAAGEDARRAENLADIAEALLIVGGAFYTLESVHQFESCTYLGNARFDCKPVKIGAYTWGAVGA